jgi:hypothetical protein
MMASQSGFASRSSPSSTLKVTNRTLPWGWYFRSLTGFVSENREEGFLARGEKSSPGTVGKECILHFGIVHELNMLRLLYLAAMRINNW